MARSFLLVPCLLIGLGCATPFPLDSLEEGMTTEAVREKFGAPEAISSEPGGMDSSWGYVNEEQNWFFTVISSTLFLPHCIFLTAATLPPGANGWCASALPTIEKGKVVLHFEEENLVRWETLPAPSVPTTDTYAYDSDLFETHPWPFPDHSKKDTEHHRRGHDHHHDDDVFSRHSKKDTKHHRKGHDHHHDDDD